MVVEPPPSQSQQPNACHEGGQAMIRKPLSRALLICSIAASMYSEPLAAEPLKLDFSNETVGAEPKSLIPIVGTWRMESERGKTVLAVDGRQWKEGQSAAGIADK